LLVTKNSGNVVKFLSIKEIVMASQISKNTKSVILVTHRIKESGGRFVAFCPELLVTTQGNTVEEANNNLKEAVILHLETLDQLGIRSFA